MLGADPEFMMQSLEGQIVLASKYFPRFGSVGCDAIWHGQNRSHKPLVELRPRPHEQPTPIDHSHVSRNDESYSESRWVRSMAGRSAAT